MTLQEAIEEVRRVLGAGWSVEELLVENLKPNEFATILNAVVKGEIRSTPEYQVAMGEAGDAYIRSAAYNNKHTLPAMFRWSELWDVLNESVVK